MQRLQAFGQLPGEGPHFRIVPGRRPGARIRGLHRTRVQGRVGADGAVRRRRLGQPVGPRVGEGRPGLGSIRTRTQGGRLQARPAAPAAFLAVRLALQAPVEVGTLHQLHGEEPVRPLGVQLEQVHQVRVGHIRHGAEFLLDQEDRARARLVRHLQGHLVLAHVVIGLEHLPEAAGPQAAAQGEAFSSLEAGQAGQSRARRRTSGRGTPPFRRWYSPSDDSAVRLTVRSLLGG